MFGVLNKLLIKYKKTPVQMRASFWFLVCAFLQKGISFITTPIFTRLLSTAEYGQYGVFNSWLGILTGLVTLNLYYGVYTRGLIKFEDERKVFSSSMQGLTLTLIIAWTLIYWTFHQIWNQFTGLNTIQMILMFQIMWSTASFTFWSMEQRVDFKYRKLVLITAVVSVAKPVLGIIFILYAEDKVTARIFGLALVELCFFTFCFLAQMIRGKKFFSSKFWKHALLFNIPLIPHYLAASVLSGADRIMINSMIGKSEAGIYGLAYSISMVMTMFNTALIQTIEPWLYKKIKEKRIEDISHVAYPVFVLIALVNLILIALAPEAVRIFAPAEYYEAIYVIPPIAMSVFFMFSYTFFAVFEFYYERTKFIAFSTSMGAILNVILNYIFIKIFGYYAAGYTTLVCYIIYVAFHFYFARKICKKELDNVQPCSVKAYISISVVFIAFGLLFLASYGNWILRYMLILFFVVIAFTRWKYLVEFSNRILGLRKKS